MKFSAIKPEGHKRLAEGSIRIEGTNEVVASELARRGAGREQVSERAREVVGSSSVLAAEVGQDADLLYTLGESKQEGEVAVVPFVIWYRFRK